MLDLRRLHLLRELSVLGTIAKVAEAAGLTRPAVSQQLAKLEVDAGTVLFERSGRGVKLTAAGLRLATRANELFSLAESIEAELGADLTEVRGEIRLCAFGSAAYCLLPFTLRTLIREHPNLDVFVREQETRDGLKAVASRQADLAIVDDLVNTQTFHGQLDFQPLCRDAFVAVLPAAHRLASRGTIDLAELAHERWVGNAASAPYQAMILNACLEHGFSPRIRASFRNMMATTELVRSSGFVAVQPSFAVHGLRKDPDFAIRPIGPALGRGVSIAFARGSAARPSIAAVADALRQAVDALGLAAAPHSA